jgi:TPR repeat protein
MTVRKTALLKKNAAKGDAEAIFQLGLIHWEKCKADSDFAKAKEMIGEAKSKGHPVADMYWDIICAFENAGTESR